MRLLLDEHISPIVAAQLKRLGHDVHALSEYPDLLGLDDMELLAHAMDQGRVFVSADHSTMPTAAQSLSTTRGTHGGVILISPKRHALNRGNPGPLIAALTELIERPSQEDLVGQILWL